MTTDLNRYQLCAMRAEEGVRVECKEHFKPWAEVETVAEAVRWAEVHETAYHQAAPKQP